MSWQSGSEQGHKASATRMILDRQRSASTCDCSSDTLILRRSLQEKLNVLTTLHSKIVNLVEEGSVADEIEQTDACKEGIYDDKN